MRKMSGVPLLALDSLADKISTVDSSDKMDTAGAAAADSQPPDDGSTLPTAVIVLGMAGSGKSSLMQV